MDLIKIGRKYRRNSNGQSEKTDEIEVSDYDTSFVFAHCAVSDWNLLVSCKQTLEYDYSG